MIIKLVYEEENKDKKNVTIQRGVIYDNQVYIVEYKANEKFYKKISVYCRRNYWIVEITRKINIHN
jgi:hypothetical protein